MILAIASAGRTTELWLLPTAAHDGNSALQHELWESGRTLADELLGHVHILLTNEAADWPDLSGIVILSGPGSFTSLRIAHTVVNTLAKSLNLPLASASGEDWLERALEQLPHRKAGEPVWPLYGGEANISKPRST